MDCYCVFGNFIGYSKLLLIYCLFVEQIGEVLVYDV